MLYPMSIFGSIHLQHWYPNYPNPEYIYIYIYQYSGYNIQNIYPYSGYDIQKIYIHNMDITSRQSALRML